MSQIKVELQEVMGSDRAIAEAAWTSSTEYQNKKLRSDEDIARIVNMLADLKHSVPFESVVFRFWIRLPISADRQHMTHRIASHSGMSGRYRTMPDDFYLVPDDCKIILDKAFNNEVLTNYYIDRHNLLCLKANEFYRQALKDFKEAEQSGKITNKEYKRLREVFRNGLPQGNMTERVTVMNLRSFANYQMLRNSEHAQDEIRQVAQLMLAEVEKLNVCPIAIEALKKNEWKI